MTEIRFAARGDVPVILRFVKELAAFEREPDVVTADVAMLEAAMFDERAAEALIAEREGEAVGFALFFHNFSTFEGRPGLYLEDLFVLPEARGLGAGKALLSRLAALAMERDCARLEWSVLDWNEPSIAFYRALGARAMDEWTVQRVDGQALVRLAALQP